MCGIVGYYGTSEVKGGIENLYHALRKIVHRGPDDQGLTLIDKAGHFHDIKDISSGDVSKSSEQFSHHIALGHVRFSIVDLSSAGHQPFFTADESICISFNGEIYNYVELRDELKSLGVVFHTNTDTEVLAEAYKYWGVDCFDKFVGFWAVALFDRRTNKLLLARDRLGKAPLYICNNKNKLLWSSEIKGILSMASEEHDQINASSIFHFSNWLKRDFDNSTFYKNIQTVPRASYAWVQDDGSLDIHSYWNLPTTRLTEKELPVEEALEQFRNIMQDAVRIRLRADVPVAVQLSGGMDSSTLLATSVEFSDSVSAYTVKYGYGDQDEEPFARMVAEQYADNVDYHVIKPSDDNFIDELPDYTRLMGEPYHSPNQLSSQHIWRQMAEDGLRVVIYGAGGDEVFSGYKSEYYHLFLKKLLSQGHGLTFLKEFFSCSEYPQGLALKEYAIMAAKLLPKIPKRSSHGQVRFVDKRINPLNQDFLEAMNQPLPTNELYERQLENMADWRMNYWLRIDNQNSMGVPVELRSPFLDHRLMDFAFTLPETYLIRDGWLKWIVRKAMEDKLPKEIVWRRTKMGFPFPLKEWLVNNKDKFLEMLSGVDCPYIDLPKLGKHYVELATRHDEYLWGLLSILLWWKFSVKEQF